MSRKKVEKTNLEKLDELFKGNEFSVNKFGASGRYHLRRYIFGSHFAPYLINGDDSGLEEGEAESLEEYLTGEGISSGLCIDSVDYGFTHSPDYGLPNDCCFFIFRKEGWL